MTKRSRTDLWGSSPVRAASTRNPTALQWLRFGVNFKMEFVAVINYEPGGELQRRYMAKHGY